MNVCEYLLFPKRRARAEFVRGKRSVPDDEFLEALGAQPDAHGAALAVRRIIAGYCHVPPESIEAGDDLDELISIGLLEGVDELDFHFRLERELGGKLRRDRSRFPRFVPAKSMEARRKFGDWVHEILAYIRHIRNEG